MILKYVEKFESHSIQNAYSWNEINIFHWNSFGRLANVCTSAWLANVCASYCYLAVHDSHISVIAKQYGVCLL